MTAPTCSVCGTRIDLIHSASGIFDHTAALPDQSDALTPIRALRITPGQIRLALEHMGPTGTRGEAWIKVAALAAADSLAALATSAAAGEGGEAR